MKLAEKILHGTWRVVLVSSGSGYPKGGRYPLLTLQPVAISMEKPPPKLGVYYCKACGYWFVRAKPWANRGEGKTRSGAARGALHATPVSQVNVVSGKGGCAGPAVHTRRKELLAALKLGGEAAVATILEAEGQKLT